MDLSYDLETRISARDIDRLHRVGALKTAMKQPSTRNIIVKFTNSSACLEIFKTIWDGTAFIYINEDLASFCMVYYMKIIKPSDDHKSNFMSFVALNSYFS